LVTDYLSLKLPARIPNYPPVKWPVNGQMKWPVHQTACSILHSNVSPRTAVTKIEYAYFGTAWLYKTRNY